LLGQNTNPSAPAPHSTAAAASSARVMPQIFTTKPHPGDSYSCDLRDLCALCALCVLCYLCVLCVRCGRGEQLLQLFAWVRGGHEPLADQERAIAELAQPKEIRGRPQSALADRDDFRWYLGDQLV